MERLLHDADTALYQAKNAGRDRVEPSLGKPDPSVAPTAAKSIFWV
jgi:hypothetical protein